MRHHVREGALEQLRGSQGAERTILAKLVADRLKHFVESALFGREVHQRFGMDRVLPANLERARIAEHAGHMAEDFNR